MAEGNETPRQLSPEDLARRYLGEAGLPGDASNAYAHVPIGLGNPNMRPARTYEDYIRNLKFARNPEAANAVMRLSDVAKVQQFDALIARLNEEIKKNSTVEAQSAAINPILGELEKLTWHCLVR